MTERSRVNLVLSADALEKLENLSNRVDCSRAEIMRRALDLLLLAHECRKDGRYVGAVQDRKKLDTEFVGFF